MNRAEWAEIAEWISDRFSRPWTQKQIEAYYYDLRMFDIGAVKEAVQTIYSKGITRPPTGSEVLAIAREIHRGGDSNPKLDIDECRHIPMDDEGYCTACGAWPKIRLRHDDPESKYSLDDLSAVRPDQKVMLAGNIGDPPEEQNRTERVF